MVNAAEVERGEPGGTSVLDGPAALRAHEEALWDIRREEDEIARRLVRSAELMARIHETEGELLLQLAAARGDAAVQTALATRLDVAGKQARELFEQHAQDLHGAEAQLRAQDQAIAALGEERVALAARADDLQAELATLAEQVNVEAEATSDLAAQRRTADALQRVAEASRHKVAQAESDREQKGRPYRDDPLFMYLWKRGYETASYRAGRPVRWLDGRVARLVGYDRARPNFAMLNEIPLRLRAHAERQQEKAQAAQTDVLRLEREAVDGAGGLPLRTALDAAQTRIAEIEIELMALEDARDTAAATRRQLAEGCDPAFSGAVAALLDALEHEDVRALLEQTRRAGPAGDDAIVTKIDHARGRAQEETHETREQRARLQALAERRRELEDIAYEVRRAGFDGRHSHFADSELVGELLNAFLRGDISAAGYWEAWRRCQSWDDGRQRAQGNSGFSRPRGDSTDPRRHGTIGRG